MSAPAAGGALQARSFHHSLYTPERIAAEREKSVSVCLPARECAGTVASVVTGLVALREAGAIDQVLVVDAGSADGTADVAAAAGALVWQEGDLLPEYGPVLGKGDAMWRSLSAIQSDLVCFLDADTAGFSAHFATGLLGPLLCEEGISFVKGFYRRPFTVGAETIEEGGGRVNHLTARPALALFYPELAGFRQPLAGEVAGTRELLQRIPFATGYGVEVAMLIDVWREVGLEGMAQVDLDEHVNSHQPLSALTPMALTVLSTIARRVAQDGRMQPLQEGGPVERPPLAGAGG